MAWDTSQVRQLGGQFQSVSGSATSAFSSLIAKTGHDIEAAAKGIVPVDTGNLRNSISTSVSGLSAEIGPSANYGVYVEMGTYKMSAQPYMGPAADQIEPAFVQAAEELGAKLIGD